MTWLEVLLLVYGAGVAGFAMTAWIYRDFMVAALRRAQRREARRHRRPQERLLSDAEWAVRGVVMMGLLWPLFGLPFVVDLVRHRGRW